MNIGINKNIKRLSGIAAILMLAVVVIGCKHNVNNKPETFTVTFGVDGTGGTLKATVDGSEINSGNKVEHGKTVTFTATPDAGYTVKEWKADGSAVTGSTSNTYTCTVTKALTVKVSFLAGGASYTVKHYQEKAEGGYPAEPAESENQNGTVGANAAYTPKTGGAYEGFTYKSALTKVNNTVQTEGTINADSSTVVELYYERNTVNVTFKLAGGNVAGDTGPIVKTGKYGTAFTAADEPVKTDFVFKGWNSELPSPLLFPKANAEYTAQWAPVYAITFNVDGGVGGTLKATADGVAETETSPITVEHGKTVTFTAMSATGYRVKGWTLDGTAIAEAGTNTEYTLTITQAVNVTVSFEPKKAILTLEAGKNTVKVKAKTADGKPITVEGCNVNELANEAETTLTVTDSDRKLALIGDIIELDCSGDENVGGNRPLIALDVSGCTALQKLNCQYNQIPELDVQGLTALQELNCQYNQIPELDVQGLTKLQKLYCQDNKLSTLNVSGCTALKELICINNQISELNVQGCATLKVLNCRYNKIAELNVSGLTELQELICNVNKIPELNVQGLTKLQQLKCGGNQLKTLDVQGLTELQQLYCQNNQLPALDVQDLATLQKLDCSENQLKTLNVQGCTALKELICYQNKLNADVFTKLLNDLPTREVSDGAEAILYAQPGVYNPQVEDGNCKNFTTPESLKKAFEGAKAKHWKLQKAGHFGFGIDI